MHGYDHNIHIPHLEEYVLDEGMEGIKYILDVFHSLVKLCLTQKNIPDLHLSQKIDGSPSLITGVDPKTQQFFVATKSVFNKFPKINYTLNDIKLNHPVVLWKLLDNFLKYFPETGLTHILQGDVLYGDPTHKQLRRIGGKDYITFTPNLLTYGVDVNRFPTLANHIHHSKIGIIFHTQYISNDVQNDGLYKIPGLNLTGLNPLTPSVFVDEASVIEFPIFSQKLNNDVAQLVKELTSWVTIINLEFLKKIENNVTVRDLIKRFMNYAIVRNLLIDVHNFQIFINDYHETKIQNLKSGIAILKHVANHTNLTNWLFSSTGKKSLYDIFGFICTTMALRDLLVSHLEPLAKMETFIEDEGKLIPSSSEGFVLQYQNRIVKLVNRYDFSRKNFLNRKE